MELIFFIGVLIFDIYFMSAFPDVSSYFEPCSEFLWQPSKKSKPNAGLIVLRTRTASNLHFSLGRDRHSEQGSW